MPKPLTVTLNANQSKKFVYLIPEGALDIHTRILKDAHNKFRIKSLKRVFLPGGTELGPDDELPASVSQVFVSKGEEFVGRAADLPSDEPAGDVRIFAEKSFVDDKAVAQLLAVAALPGVRVACGMPDLHPGDRFPIGCAVAADGVYPALIGSDIGCGIALYELAASARLAAQPAKLASLLRGLDEPWDGSAAEWLAKYGLESREEFEASLGSVGLGNHFAELCIVEKVVDEAEAGRLGVNSESLYLLGEQVRTSTSA